MGSLWPKLMGKAGKEAVVEEKAGLSSSEQARVRQQRAVKY